MDAFVLGGSGVTSTTGLTAARLQRPGPHGARVLLIAGRSWLAPSVSSDDRRVPVRLLDRLWLSTRRGVQLDVVCGVERVLKVLGAVRGGWDVADYDAVVLLPDLDRPALGARLQRVVDRVSAATRVLRVSPWHDPGGAGAAWTDVRIGAEPGDCSAAMVAEAVSAGIAGVLDAVPAAAVDAAHVDTVTDHLQRIAALAAEAFSVDSSAIAVTALGRPRTLAIVGALDGPPCASAAVSPTPTLVLDTWRDERCAADPLLVDRERVRFFAAHPLEGDAGAPFGTISVADPEPRLPDEFDPEVLRDLAVLASAEIQYAGASA